MRIRWWIGRTIFAVIALLAIVELVVIFNLVRINSAQFARLETRGQNISENNLNDSEHATSSSQENTHNEDSLQRLRRETLSRAALYDELIQRDMLLDGMVVHLGAGGEPKGICDSLMFSSIRFYALNKLGFKNSAQKAWQGIIASRSGGQWLRHPRCTKSLSRDMIMGVLVALRGDPEEGDAVFRSMLAKIDRNGGFAGDGPFYVSWLSPGIASLLRMEAERRQVPFSEWPWVLKHSFSSIEFDAMFLDEGYVSHLAGIGLWLEVSQPKDAAGFNPRSFFGRVARSLSGESSLDTKIDTQRRQWISGRLRSISSSNLFFEWLELNSSGDLNSKSEARLLSALLSMPQFPKTHLPQDCNRDADYLWQRREAEAIPAVEKCGETWSGVDFLWMASLLGVHADVAPPSRHVPLPLAH
jgi:hypothetical protein